MPKASVFDSVETVLADLCKGKVVVFVEAEEKLKGEINQRSLSMLRATLLLFAFVSSSFADDSIFPSDAKLEKLFTGHGETEGVTSAPDGMIYFSDITLSQIVRDERGVTEGGHIWRYDPGTGKTTLFRSPSNKSNGLEFDAAGNLIACEGADYGGRRVSRTDMKTGLCSILTARFDGRPYNAPNDLGIDAKGRIYFTDPKYVGPEALEQPEMGVYRIDTDNKVTRIITDAGKPNGILVSPDQRTLYVVCNDNGAEGVDALLDADKKPPPLRRGTMALLAYDLHEDGSATFRKVLVDYSPEAGPDGLTCDAKGNLFVACRSEKRPGVCVYTPEGKELAYLKVEHPPTNVAFGRGADAATLYITAGSDLLRIKTGVSVKRS